MQRSPCQHFPALLFAPLLLVVGAGAAGAQSRSSCQASDATTFGVAIGRSSPYLEFDRRALPPLPTASSVGVCAGAQVSGRAERSVAGPFRFRVEGSMARWGVESRTYVLN